jgi:hypothetical protein
MRKQTLAALIAAAMAGGASAGTGPSSSATPYMTGSGPGIGFTSILTVGDAAPTGYRMAGIPDGLGAFDNGNGTFTVLMNHEISTGDVVRAHGGTGSFVSAWTIRKSDLGVVAGRDLITTANLWNGTNYVASTSSFARFCSGDLAPVSGLYNAASALGTTARVYFTGEENGNDGRAIATVASGANVGQAYQLYKLGGNSWENVLVSPKAQDKTIVAGTSDGGDSQLRIYVGNKTNTGTEIERAGLTNGTTYSVKVAAGNDQRAAPLAGSFSLVAGTGTGSTFLRPEDGAWDTKNPNRFYFVTTDRFDQVKDGVGTQDGRSRLYSLTFDDIADPTKGGRIEALLTGTEVQNMLDNLTVTADGKLILQEDVGNQAHLGKVYEFDPVTKRLTLLASHDKARFGDLNLPAAAPFNVDEESSGVIEVTDLFKGEAGYDTVNNRYFLLDVQAHYGMPSPMVEGGQLLLMTQAVPEPQTSALMIGGLGVVGFVARRRRPR